MPSCIASSFSHGDAFISSKPERTMTLHVLAAEAPRDAAAIHRGVAAAEHDRRACRSSSMWPNDTLRQPVDADVDVRRGFLAARNVEIAAARRAGADEYRVVAFAPASAFEAIDALAAAKLDAEIEDVADLLVDHRLGQAESAESGVRIMPPACGSPSNTMHVVAERRQIARDGQRRRAGADAARCACRCFARRVAAAARGCRPCSRRRRASGGRSRPARACVCRCSSSTRPRRHAGSHGRSQVRPRMPGKTFDFQLTM